jgi:hypothetical protein
MRSLLDWSIRVVISRFAAFATHRHHDELRRPISGAACSVSTPIMGYGHRVGVHGAAPSLGTAHAWPNYELDAPHNFLRNTDVVPRPIRNHNFGATLFVGAVGLLMLMGFLLSIIF